MNKTVLVLIIALCSFDHFNGQTIALWPFDEKQGIYPNSVFSDHLENDYPLVIGNIKGAFRKHLNVLEDQEGNIRIYTTVDDEIQLTDLKDHKFYSDIIYSKITPNGSKLLLDTTPTNRNELTLVPIEEGKLESSMLHNDMERSIFVLEGEGKITVAEETESVKEGHLIYVPRNIFCNSCYA